jgi:hypothetical protein
VPKLGTKQLNATASQQGACISKAEFARRRNVSPGRVSQWIAEKKIFGSAIVGEGRGAQINEPIAVEQLRTKLDVLQMTGNGVATNLATPETSAAILPLLPRDLSALSPAGVEPADRVEEKIKQARLEQIDRQNREGRRREALEAGLLTDAAAAKAAAAREIAKIVTAFEGSLSDFAMAISAEFKLPQRDVLHLLRSKFRETRAGLAHDARAEADGLPTTMSIDLGDETDS